MMSSPFHIPAAADPTCSMSKLKVWWVFLCSFPLTGCYCGQTAHFLWGQKAESTSEQTHLLLHSQHSPSPLFKVTCCSSHKEHPQPEWLLHIIFQVPSIPFRSAKNFQCKLSPAQRCPPFPQMPPLRALLGTAQCLSRGTAQHLLDRAALH